MKKTLHSVIQLVSKRAVLYLSLWMLLTSSFSAIASSYINSEFSTRQEAYPTKTATALAAVSAKVSRRLSPPDSLDFEVQSISRRHFRISFINRSGRSVFVKIYDVIGNLLKQEKINRKGEFKKDYDLSDTHTEFYVIEVGNTKTTVVKRLFPSEATSL